MVPRPGNPQSLNRYSYVLNSPLKFVDPSGHWSCDPYDSGCAETEDEWNSYYEMKGDFAAYADYQYSRIGQDLTDLEFVERVTDFRARHGTPESFVDDISRYILGGQGGRDTITFAPAHRHFREFHDTGFREYYQDGGNQVNHAWYWVHVAYTTGEAIARRGNEVHENPGLPIVGGGQVGGGRVGPVDVPVIIPGGGASQLDLDLGNSAIALGLGIRNGTIPLVQVSNWIHANWGPVLPNDLSNDR